MTKGREEHTDTVSWCMELARKTSFASCPRYGAYEGSCILTELVSARQSLPSAAADLVLPPRDKDFQAQTR